jgi:hypothetical protein
MFILKMEAALLPKYLLTSKQHKDPSSESTSTISYFHLPLTIMGNFEGSTDKNENITWYSCYLVQHRPQKSIKKGTGSWVKLCK